MKYMTQALLMVNLWESGVYKMACYEEVNITALDFALAGQCIL